MTTRQGTTHRADPVAIRSLEVLAQMCDQLLAGRKWRVGEEEHLRRLRADLTKLVHAALHDHGDPGIVARILDCYRRCEVDIDDTTVRRRVRGVVKGELRKAGIDPTLPGLDPALDVATIILTTRRTVKRLGGASSSTSAPSPALDRKPPPAAAPPAKKPPTVRVAQPPTTTRRRPATPMELRAAFEQLIAQALALFKKAGRQVERPDYVAAIYNDPAKKARLVDQILDAVPSASRPALEQVIDGFFRDGFKGVYIERTDRQGNRRAHKR